MNILLVCAMVGIGKSTCNIKRNGTWYVLNKYSITDKLVKNFEVRNNHVSK